MKRLIVSGFAFAAMATAALAQQAPAPAEQVAPAATQDHPSPPPPPGAPEARDRPDEMWPRDHAGQPPKDASRQEMGMRGHHRPMPPPPSKAAHFRVEDGDKKIDVKCADDEPTKVCADVLLQLIDKLATSSDMFDDERD
jgi:hypothetical protein